MTIDASGWLDPRLAELAGKTALDWVYGPNHPDAQGPGYWAEACSSTGRGYPRGQAPNFIAAGVAIDEWTPPERPENIPWLCEGLRKARRDNPNVFIAIWTTDPTPPLTDLGKEGMADLIIVEGYTHSAAEFGPGLVTSWENALRRCDALAAGGLESKTIYCFGHITAKTNSRGELLEPRWIRDRAEEIKRRYPKMPGVAFYQHAAEDSKALRELIRACDGLSGELWPDVNK